MITAHILYTRYPSHGHSTTSSRYNTFYITQSLSPTKFHVYNDSHLHAHHKAMQGATSRETHFRSRLEITSNKFEGLRGPERHRLVYELLKEEMEKKGGIHALQLKTRTEEENRKEQERKLRELEV
ncbi:bola-like protein-domain-containing protein [Peziza echinospora]|nr:bola-like protein-domain-containing protein [Peziza echinospora]